MRCEECGKAFIQLAVHLRGKHHINPDDYRRQHNIPLTVALVDESLREHLSKQAKIRFLTEEGLEHLRRIQSLCDHQKQTGVKRNLPAISTYHCFEKNQRKSVSLRKTKLPAVLKSWIEGDSNRDIAMNNHVSLAVLKKWVGHGYLPKRKMKYVLK